jgi:Amt family ammonium transporter
MHLRVHEEAEMIGLDRAQFVDEQIGERVILDELFGSSSTTPAHASVVNESVGISAEPKDLKM